MPTSTHQQWSHWQPPVPPLQERWLPGFRSLNPLNLPKSVAPRAEHLWVAANVHCPEAILPMRCRTGHLLGHRITDFVDRTGHWTQAQEIAPLPAMHHPLASSQPGYHLLIGMNRPLAAIRPQMRHHRQTSHPQTPTRPSDHQPNHQHRILTRMAVAPLGLLGELDPDPPRSLAPKLAPKLTLKLAPKLALRVLMLRHPPHFRTGCCKNHPVLGSCRGHFVFWGLASRKT